MVLLLLLLLYNKHLLHINIKHILFVNQFLCILKIDVATADQQQSQP